MDMNIEITTITPTVKRKIQIKSKKPPENYSHEIVNKLEDFFNNKQPKINIFHLTSLTLIHCNIKTLPDNISHLRLTKLNISHNLIKTVPPCLYLGLKDLLELNLSYNLIEEFVTELECVPKLKKLNLSNNELKNLPKWILNYKCVHLENLNYSNNRAKHYIALKNSYFKSISQIKELSLKNSCLLDDDYNFLKGFKMLEFLDMSNDGEKFKNIFKDLDELFVKPQWVNVKVLVLEELSISVFPEGLLWLESLRELYLRNNYLYFIPDEVKYLVNLEVLDLSKNEIASLNDKLFELKLLRKLYLSGNYLSRFVMGDNSLEVLDLYDNFIEEFTCDIENIMEVDLEQNYYDTTSLKYEDKLLNIRKNIKSCHLRFNGCKHQIKQDENSSCTTDSPYESENSENDFQDSNFNENFDENRQSPEENWDEPTTPTQKISKNPLITNSDDEWEGYKPKSKKTDQSKPREYVDNEAFYYKDALEDFSVVS